MTELLNWLELIKIKNHCFLKDPVKQMKDYWLGENICKICIWNGMVSTIHKLNSKKTIQLKYKQKILDFWSRLLTKEYILMAVCIWKMLHILYHTPTMRYCSVQSLRHVHLFASPWSAACQAYMSITNSSSLLKLMSIESVMPSNHLILRQTAPKLLCFKVN